MVISFPDQNLFTIFKGSRWLCEGFGPHFVKDSVTRAVAEALQGKTCDHTEIQRVIHATVQNKQPKNPALQDSYRRLFEHAIVRLILKDSQPVETFFSERPSSSL